MVKKALKEGFTGALIVKGMDEAINKEVLFIKDS